MSCFLLSTPVRCWASVGRQKVVHSSDHQDRQVGLTAIQMPPGHAAEQNCVGFNVMLGSTCGSWQERELPWGTLVRRWTLLPDYPTLQYVVCCEATGQADMWQAQCAERVVSAGHGPRPQDRADQAGPGVPAGHGAVSGGQAAQAGQQQADAGEAGASQAEVLMLHGHPDSHVSQLCDHGILLPWKPMSLQTSYSLAGMDSRCNLLAATLSDFC